MKNIMSHWAYLTAVTVAIIFVGLGCGGSAGSAGGGEELTDAAKIKEALIGTWEETDLGGQYIFTSQGKVTEVTSFSSHTFDWKLSEDGKTITMGLDLSEPDVCSTIKLDSITEKSFEGGLVTPLNERPLPVTYKKIKSAEADPTAPPSGTNAPSPAPKATAADTNAVPGLKK